VDHRSGLDLHLDLTSELTGAAGGVGRALETALREAVRSGRLAAGTRLPGSRNLAADLGLSRGTVVQVYTQLTAEGWLIGTAGSGTRVADVPTAPPAEDTTRRAPSVPRPVLDLRPGRPDLSAFPRTAWASSVRRATAAMDAPAFDYGEPAGVPVLRAAIADYLCRTRGVRTTAESVVITPGYGPGLVLLGRTLRGLGVQGVAVEDPCLAIHRDLLRAAGVRTDPLPVDAYGADPAGLTSAVGAVVLTPAHQHPSGAVLSPGRRTAFAEWARRHGGFLVEDDYDGEFRYDRQPVGALQALAPDHVVFGGTTSKALGPGMRIGWLVVPPALRGPLLTMIAETATAVPVIDQFALADLIERGDYDRHIRRLRLVYRRRREQLARRLAPATLRGVAAGLHALLPVDSAARERRLVAAASRAGLLVQGLHVNDYWHEPDEDRPAALVLGYATPPPHAWRPSIDVLSGVLLAT
jgi:DNA-binding transcriptional MocR family regulator